MIGSSKPLIKAAAATACYRNVDDELTCIPKARRRGRRWCGALIVLSTPVVSVVALIMAGSQQEDYSSAARHLYCFLMLLLLARVMHTKTRSCLRGL